MHTDLKKKSRGLYPGPRLLGAQSRHPQGREAGRSVPKPLTGGTEGGREGGRGGQPPLQNLWLPDTFWTSSRYIETTKINDIDLTNECNDCVLLSLGK